MTNRKIARLIAAAVLGIVAYIAANQESQDEVLTGPAVVIDGDTLKIGETRIRLMGIDAPERKQSCTDTNGHEWPCGLFAKKILTQKIGSTQIRCDLSDRDKYGRYVGICYTDIDLNGFMVESGNAMAYRQYSARYIAQEDSARIHRRGIWSGSFQAPWDYRRGK